jgi:Fur family ferric uptake transcriptional regulator
MAKNNSIETLFKQIHLRSTPIRKDVFDLFKLKNVALSQTDIEAHFGTKYDRVTMYRTLHTFIERGILHKVLDDTGVSKYAICLHEHCEGDEHQHRDNHIHFKCVQCNTTLCMHDLQIPNLPLDKNFTILSANLLVEGICDKCNA